MVKHRLVYYLYIIAVNDYFVRLVLKIQFEATNFEGSESSKEISINIVIEGGIPTINISVDVSFLEATAIG